MGGLLQMLFDADGFLQQSGKNRVLKCNGIVVLLFGAIF
jgi:hypothetical protein